MRNTTTITTDIFRKYINKKINVLKTLKYFICISNSYNSYCFLFNPNIFTIYSRVSSSDWTISNIDYNRIITIGNNAKWNNENKYEIKYYKWFIRFVVMPPIDSTGADRIIETISSPTN